MTLNEARLIALNKFLRGETIAIEGYEITERISPSTGATIMEIMDIENRKINVFYNSLVDKEKMKDQIGAATKEDERPFMNPHNKFWDALK